MKIAKKERASDGGTISRKEGTKGNVKKTYREETTKEIDAEGKRRRYERDNFRERFTNEQQLEGKETVNGNSRGGGGGGGRRRGASSSAESKRIRRQNHGRREDVKVVRKAVSKRHEMDNYRRHTGRDNSPRGRRGRDMDPRFIERQNRVGGHHENEKGYNKDYINGGGRYEEVKRSPFGEDLTERNKRTVFIGNIPLSVKGAKHLLEILSVDEAIVEEVRIRPPKSFRYEPESAKTDKKISQKAYITLKHERDVKQLLEKDGLTYAGNVLKADMVIHSKHYDREKTILVKSLNFSVTEGQLFDMFSCFGRVKGYRLIRDRRTNKSLGYGFIYFEDKESVEKAIRVMNGKRVQNRQLIVSAMEHESGNRNNYWSGGHQNGDRRNYDYKVKKDINKRDNSYRRR